MKNIVSAILLAFCLCASAALAEEEGGEHAKPKQEEKPRPDSVLSSVLDLPTVKDWNAWMLSKKDGTSLTAWGEVLKTVNNNKCWGIAVGETKGDDTKVWKRFCVTAGGNVLVESAPDPETDEITYSPYPEWVAKCHPTKDTPGTC